MYTVPVNHMFKDSAMPSQGPATGRRSPHSEDFSASPSEWPNQLSTKADSHLRQHNASIVTRTPEKQPKVAEWIESGHKLNHEIAQHPYEGRSCHLMTPVMDDGIASKSLLVTPISRQSKHPRNPHVEKVTRRTTSPATMEIDDSSLSSAVPQSFMKTLGAEQPVKTTWKPQFSLAKMQASSSPISNLRAVIQKRVITTYSNGKSALNSSYWMIVSVLEHRPRLAVQKSRIQWTCVGLSSKSSNGSG